MRVEGSSRPLVPPRIFPPKPIQKGHWKATASADLRQHAAPGLLASRSGAGARRWGGDDACGQQSAPASSAVRAAPSASHRRLQERHSERGGALPDGDSRGRDGLRQDDAATSVSGRRRMDQRWKVRGVASHYALKFVRHMERFRFCVEAEMKKMPQQE
eukprot:scaffold146_cov265-Pinguiococcus_pyrenoidosus.AAC.27